MKNQLSKTYQTPNTTIIMNQLWVINDLTEAVANSSYMKHLITQYFENPNCRAFDWIVGEKLSDFEKATFIYACGQQLYKSQKTNM